MKVRRRPARAVENPAAALTDPMALVTALSAARLLAASLRVAYWDHDQVDRQLIAAAALLSELDPESVQLRLLSE